MQCHNIYQLATEQKVSLRIEVLEDWLQKLSASPIHLELSIVVSLECDQRAVHPAQVLFGKGFY
jgi:hypothetical protein